MSSQPISPFVGAMNGIRTEPPHAPSDSRVDLTAKRFDEALSLMQSGSWQASFDRLAELADEGHTQAARIALLFLKRGTSLFGGTFHASAAQRDGWQRASD